MREELDADAQRRPTMTESELDRWAAIYQANPRLARARIDYGDLLDDPELLFRVQEHPESDPDAYPALLPAQRRIAECIRRADEIADAVRARESARASNLAACAAHAEDALPVGARRRGGRFVEPLSHHAWAVSREVCSGTRPQR